jgi:peptidoglycan hydrolase-like protein with peptidoglycan-binding domain
MSPEQVQDLQQRLQELGHYRGEVDGLVGPQTRAALQAFFQQQAQLASQGMLSDAAIAVFNMTPEQIQPVRGEED